MNRGERGAALPETALVLTLMLSLIVGALRIALVGYEQVAADGAAFYHAHQTSIQGTYPDNAQQAGYAPCDVEAGRVVRGSDANTSGRDGDPTLDLDLGRGEPQVRDATPQLGEPYFQQLGASGVRTFSAQIALERPRA